MMTNYEFHTLRDAVKLGTIFVDDRKALRIEASSDRTVRLTVTARSWRPWRRIEVVELDVAGYEVQAWLNDLLPERKAGEGIETLRNLQAIITGQEETIKSLVNSTTEGVRGLSDRLEVGKEAINNLNGRLKGAEEKLDLDRDWLISLDAQVKKVEERSSIDQKILQGLNQRLCDIEEKLAAAPKPTTDGNGKKPAKNDKPTKEEVAQA